MNVIAFAVDSDLGQTFNVRALFTLSTGRCGMSGTPRNNVSCFPAMHFREAVLSNDINKMAIVNSAAQATVSPWLQSARWMTGICSCQTNVITTDLSQREVTCCFLVFRILLPPYHLTETLHVFSMQMQQLTSFYRCQNQWTRNGDSAIVTSAEVEENVNVEETMWCHQRSLHL